MRAPRYKTTEPRAMQSGGSGPRRKRPTNTEEHKPMMPMVPKFFGQHLLERDILTKDQLIESINYQKSKILKLGEIAVTKGFISEKDAAKINNEQKRTDMRFGDLAVNMGLITTEQLEQIITIQKNNHIYLGEAIVACGFLDQETVDHELSQFKKEQAIIPPVEIMIKEDVAHREILEIMADLTSKLLRRLGDMQSKTGQVVTTDGPINNLGVVSILDFKGDIPCRYVLNVSWDVGMQIAKRTFKKDDLPMDRELIVDTISEFVNVVCGNVRAKAIELGKKLEFEPPYNFMDENDLSIPLKTGEKIVVVPMYTPIGNLEIALGYNS